MPGKGDAVCCPGCHRFVLSSRSESTNPLIVPAVGRPSVGVLEGQREEVKMEAMLAQLLRVHPPDDEPWLCCASAIIIIFLFIHFQGEGLHIQSIAQPLKTVLWLKYEAFHLYW